MSERVGDIIRNVFLQRKEVYGQQLYLAVKERQIRDRKGSYASFRANYLNRLSKLGLIHRTRTEPSKTPTFEPRQYWEIVPGKEHPRFRDQWINPQNYLKNLERKRRRRGNV